jgi:hypothetical protein
MEGRLITPFSMGIFASRASGKTHFVRSLLLEQERLIHTPFKKVLWIYKSWQDDLFKELNSQTNFEIEFIDDIPNTMVEKATVNTLIVIDDLMRTATSSPLVESLFTRGRHLGLSVVFLSQNLFNKGKYSRDLALNMDYIVLFKNVRDVTQITHIARQMYPNNTNFLMKAYEDATRRTYGHLFLDLKPNGEQSLRVRGNILDEFQHIYTPKNL